MIYRKILVARHSPQNHCYASDGVVLILNPKKLARKKGHIGHHFLSSVDKKTKSKYGWVKEIEQITFDQFMKTYVGTTDDTTIIDHNKIMLESIQNLDADLPVAVTYSERGVEQKSIVLTVHRVIFQRAKADKSVR